MINCHPALDAGSPEIFRRLRVKPAMTFIFQGIADQARNDIFAGKGNEK